MPALLIIPALVKILGVLKSIIGGTPSLGLEFDSNNKMNKVLKQGGQAVANHVHEVGIKFAAEMGIEPGLQVPFASELWSAIFSCFTPGQHWELMFAQQIETGFKNMFNVIDKYTPINYNPEAFLTYIIDLGGPTQIHWGKGSGKTKIQGRLGPEKWGDKLKTFFKEGYTPPPPLPPPPPPPSNKDFTVQDAIRIFNNLFPEVTDPVIHLRHGNWIFNSPNHPTLNSVIAHWTTPYSINWKNVISGVKAITTIDDYNVLWNLHEEKNYDVSNTINEYINLKKQGKGGGGGKEPIQAGFNPLIILLIAGVAFGMFKKSG
jgi:hypothetical protein